MNIETCTPRCRLRDQHLGQACSVTPRPRATPATAEEIETERKRCGESYAKGQWFPTEILTPAFIEHSSFALSGEVAKGLVSIIIPVRGAHAALARCLTALSANTDASYEVTIVVANSELPGVTSALSCDPCLTSKARLVHQDEPRGFPAACNAGVRASRGEFIVLLNSDAYVTGDWLEQLMAALQHPAVGAVGAVGPFVSGQQGAFQGYARDKINEAIQYDWGAGFDVLNVTSSCWAQWREHVHTEPYAVNGLIGYCLAMRRSTWNIVGGLWEGLGLGNFDDDDLSIRLRLIEKTMLVVPKALVLHEGNASFRDLWGAEAPQKYEELLRTNKEILRTRWEWASPYFAARMKLRHPGGG